MIPPEQYTDHLRRLDREHVWHPFTPMKLWLESDPLVITAADGMHLIDSDGNRYLDGVSSLWCNVHGHRVREIDDAIRAQLDKVAHTTMLGLANEAATLLAERLITLAPQSLKKVFYSDAGATATEIAFKLAVQYWHNIGQPQKREFIAFSGSYHGDTFGAISVGRTEIFHRAYLPLMFKTHYVPSPKGAMEQSLTILQSTLAEHHDRIAAICIEPIVQGAAGMIVHPQGFLKEVRAIASKFNTLLICDEVATGFGRTGKMFAVEHENVQPDLMCVGKGLTGGCLPLAATLASQQIFDAFLGEVAEGKTFYHGHTYTGNPLACAAALANLDLFEKNQLLAAVQQKSQALATMLAELQDHPYVGEIRQKGFMIGIELVAEKTTRRPFDPSRRAGAEICTRIRRHGVILRPLGDVIVLMPPLAMGLADLRTIVNAVKLEIQNF
jgi:adenosylmethionine-8-amino-7-oxononanoate aminotransferase